MTDPHYKIISLNEAKARGLDYWEDWEELDEYDEYNYGLWFFDASGRNRFVNRDGGEPEDQTLNRDWSWVAGELNRALEYGMPTAQWDPDDGETSDDIDNGRTSGPMGTEEFLQQLDSVPDSAKRPGVFDTTTDADIPTRERIELDNIEPW